MAISTNCSLVDNLVGSLYPKMNNVHVVIKNPVNDTDSTKKRQIEMQAHDKKLETKIENRKIETKIENRNVYANVLGCGIELTGGVKQTAC